MAETPQITFTPDAHGNPDAIFNYNPDNRCPVAHTPFGAEVRVVTHDEDVRAVLAQRVFGLVGVPLSHALTGTPFQGEHGLLAQDGEQHAAVRKLVAPFLTTEGAGIDLAKLQLTAESYTPIHGRYMNVASEYTLSIMRHVFRQMTGLTMGDFSGVLFHGGRALDAAILRGPDPSSVNVGNYHKSWDEAYREYGDMIASAKTAQKDTMLDRLVGVLEGAGMTDEQVVQTVASVFNGMLAPLATMDVCIEQLMRHPEAIQACLKDPALWRPTVNELIRLKAHPTIALPRIALEDTVLGGTAITKGTVVVPSIHGALHDPAVADFPPDEFSPAGKARRTTAFGAGPHFCPAAELSLDVFEVAISTLFKAHPSLRLRDGANLSWTRDAQPSPLSLPVVAG